MNRIAYWLVMHWPFSIYNRFSWAVYLWLIQYAGIEAERLLELEVNG